MRQERRIALKIGRRHLSGRRFGFNNCHTHLSDHGSLELEVMAIGSQAPSKLCPRQYKILPIHCGRSSIGRAWAFQAQC